MSKLAVYGASGHGKVVADCAEYCNWNEVYFFDDTWPQCKNNSHWEIIGDYPSLLSTLADFDGVIVAIGNNLIRYEKLLHLKENSAPLVTLVHPSAQISQYTTIGIGSVVLAGTVINVDTTIGIGCIINTGSSIDHDCSLGDAVHICPGARLAGSVSIGARSWIGIGAAIKQHIRVHDDVIVGAGSVIIRDIEDCAIVAGVPAKALR
ncbi:MULTISPECIES: acetyltransferase [unclassified Ketobacter]|uniref:acetyltransferase n=1 Tax=unclassified Ketobacter TaxID=2639109 RepID=UPI000F2D5FED|nr:MULTISPECIES: acetyltransferase [unclassified Ketobacter]RLT87609.1 MAG: acetyltransferase [Ketobacter sp. GenoA1]RLT92938.1 MAG: acetyltransferase [Ketobacter sp.]